MSKAPQTEAEKLARRLNRGMTNSPIEIAADVQRSGLISDNNELEQNGIKPVSEEAVPYYAAWTRTDIAFSSALLGQIANDTKELVKYTKLIATLLFLILIGLLFWRFR